MPVATMVLVFKYQIAKQKFAFLFIYICATLPKGTASVT